MKPGSDDATRDARLRAALAAVLQRQAGLAFAALVGSQATGTATPASDWDIALLWLPAVDAYTALGNTETLRRELAAAIGEPEAKIDLIDLRRANLAMRASVAGQGQLLAGGDTLYWFKFLQRTWRELEDYEWSKRHVA